MTAGARACIIVFARNVRNTLPLKGGIYMELAKITSKGQITIPVDIRRKLGVKQGDKVLFIEEAGKIYILNSSMEALRVAQAAFAGEAQRSGLKDEGDVVSMMKDFRRERTKK
jgi:antitoxin PrlF